MKRTNFVTKLISVILFVGLLAYGGVYIVNSISNDLRTAPAVFVEILDSTPATGVIVRDEKLLDSSEKYLSVIAQNGQLISSGGIVAIAYSSEEALVRAGRLRELELQRQYILSSQEASSSDSAVTKREKNIKNYIISLAASAARHEPDELSAAVISLSSLVLNSSAQGTNSEDLESINSEISQLQQSSLYDTSAIKAPAQGLFFASTDGFEHVAPSQVKGITPDALRELISGPQETSENVIGKLVSPLEWYFAALIAPENAERLDIGDSVTLDFGRYCSGTVPGTIVSMRTSDDDACAVVFRCTTSTAELLYARNVSAELVFGSHSGIRVPKEAVYIEERPDDFDVLEDGPNDWPHYYVYTVTGIQAEKKYIQVVWETADYYIAKIDAANPSALRIGNDIILTKDNITDKMLLD